MTQQKIFISWSGQVAQKVSRILAENLTLILPDTECFQSSEGIEKGARWSTEIATKLEESSLGILCITKENADAPWVAFEAGALSKSIKESRVVPLLLDADPSDLAGGPLAQFQATLFNKDEIGSMLKSLMRGEADDVIRKSETIFDKFWPDMQAEVEGVLEKPAPQADAPVDPVIGLLRDIRGSQMFLQNRLQNPNKIVPQSFLQRAIIEASDPKHLVQRLYEHVEYLEDLIGDIESTSSYADYENLENAVDALEEIQSEAASMVRFLEKEKNDFQP